MKKGIHPNWYHDCTVTCSCGNTFITGSTQKTIQVDICNKCHPFYTGEMKFVDRQGRVDKFMKKMQIAKQKQKKAQERLKKKKQTSPDQDKDLSYKQILRKQRNNFAKPSDQQGSDSSGKKTQTNKKNSKSKRSSKAKQSNKTSQKQNKQVKQNQDNSGGKKTFKLKKIPASKINASNKKNKTKDAKKNAKPTKKTNEKLSAQANKEKKQSKKQTNKKTDKKDKK